MTTPYEQGTVLLAEAGYDHWGYGPEGEPARSDGWEPAPEVLNHRDDAHGLGADTESVARVLGDIDLVAAWLDYEREPSTRELMRPVMSERGGDVVDIPTADGTQVRYTNANAYERSAVRYGRNPRSVTVVDGPTEWLGTYWLTTEDGTSKVEPSDGRKGRAGRKASCQCGTCRPCEERKRKAEYRARIAEQEQARLREQELSKVADRLASRSW